MPTGGNNNLIPLNERPKDEQWAIRSKGGKVNGELRRLKKTLRDELIMTLELINDELQKPNSTLITAAIIQQAISGNVKAFEVIRDTIGEKPKDEVSVEGINIKLENPEDYAR